MNRKQSSVEIRGKRSVKKASQKTRPNCKYPSQLYTSNKYEILSPVNTKNRTCGLCHKTGHFQKNCPSLLCYKKPPIVPKGKTVWDILCQDLNNTGKYMTHIRDGSDHQNVVHNFPTGVPSSGCSHPPTVVDQYQLGTTQLCRELLP